jgi:hypothetical protein
MRSRKKFHKHISICLSKELNSFLQKVVIDASTLAPMKWIPKASGKSNRFSPILDDSYLFQDFCVGEMWRPFDASIGVHVCVFSLNISDDTVYKLFVCCCCAAHLQGRRFFLGNFGVLLLLMFSLSSV